MKIITEERTHHCGQLRIEDEGKKVLLMGWILRKRPHGKIIFLDLKDKEGITQITVDPENISGLDSQLLRLGSSIGVTGIVADRVKSGGSAKSGMDTGQIEVIAEEVDVFSSAEPLPFSLDDDKDSDANEILKLKYRYLDMRKGHILKNLKLRSDATHAIRNYLSGNGFVDVETPIMMKSTPEGARDYLVPSRIEPGNFYALPQSPQLYKQLLMCGSLDKYYQIARCFRDEDLRADRQPEFTQIDIEMSYINKETVYQIVEGMFSDLFEKVLDKKIELPIRRLSYDQALEEYGEDKPDLRYGLKLVNLSKLFKDSSFKAFQNAVLSGGTVKGIRVPSEAGRSKSWLSKLEKVAKARGAKGMAWLKIKEGALQSPIAKFLSEEEQSELLSQMKATENDLILIIADSSVSTANAVLSTLRRHLAQVLESIVLDPNQFEFLWIEDFPLFEYDEETDALQMLHHPFTMPKFEDMPLLEENSNRSKSKIRALSYDLVLNGFELGSGSLRINDTNVQEKLLETVGFSKEEAEKRFGFLLEALKYGAPPHGGMGLGLDRIIMVMAGEDSLRDVVAFPKTAKAACPLSGAPGRVDEQQLIDVHIALRETKEKAKA